MKPTKKQADNPKARQGNAIIYFILASILLVTTIVYSASFKNQFTNWDDEGFITQNSIIKDLSPKGLKAIFTEYYGGNYHPLTALSHAIEWHFVKDKPLSYHVVNLIFHLLNTCLVFLFIRRLLAIKNLKEMANGVALFVALIFALHPTHVESVAWMAERKDVLYTFFYLASLLTYLNYTQGRGFQNYIYTFLLFSASLLSKSAAVTLPLVIIFTDLYISQKIEWKKVLLQIPFLTMSVIFGLVALESQHTTLNDFTTPDYSAMEKVLVACYNLCFYLVYSLFPWKLSNLHPFPDAGSLDVVFYLAPFLLIIAGFFIYKYRKIDWLWYGLGFFVLTNLLTLQFLPVGKAIAAERYTYVPYIGLFMVFGIQLWKWQPSARFGVIALLIIPFTAVSYNRMKDWKSSASIWKDCAAKYPNSYYAWFGSGTCEKDPAVALDKFNKCVELNPNYGDGYINRGSVLNQLKRYEEALSDSRKALKLEPQSATALNNRAVALENIATSTKDTNFVMLDSARADYMRCAKEMPNNAIIFYNLGNTEYDLKNLSQAILYYSKSLEIEPNFTMNYFNRGLAKLNLGRHDEACTDFNTGASLGNNDCKKAIGLVCQKINR
jgi:tetratricopeptide (TPR) repeat protein